MQGPVFARAAKDAIDPNSPKVVASNEANQSSDLNNSFDLKDLTFSCDSASSVVADGFIPHFAMTSCANMNVLRKLLTGHSLENVLLYTESSEYFRHVSTFVQDLKVGNSLAPFVYDDPDVRPLLIPGKDLRHTLEDNWCYPCKANRPLSQIACDTTLLVRQDKDGVLSGYRHQAALVEAMDYPDELLSILKDFAALFPNDILPLRTLLLGCHLWADITGHRTLSLERFFEKRKDQSAVPPVPDIPLAVCLILYPHWLKWTELMGLSEFPHPFRFMSQAIKSDMDKEAIGIDPESIDQGRVYSLIAKAKSRIPLMDATYRLEIMPCYMPGSRMPPMFGPMARRPEKAPLALTGLPDVQYLGLGSYVRPDNSKDERPARMQSIRRTSKYTTVALPRHARDSLFIPPGELFRDSEGPDNVFNKTHKRQYMEPAGSEVPLAGRPRKKHCGPDVTQSDKSTSRVTVGVMPSASAGPGYVPVFTKYDEILEAWAEARLGVAHWAHQEGLRQVKHQPRFKLRETIEKAFDQEEADAMQLLREFGIWQASKSFPLDDDYLSIDLPLKLGRMLGLRPPEKLVPGLWTTHFMPQCLEKGARVYLRAQSIQSTLQRSRYCYPWEQKKIIGDEVIRVLSEVWGKTPNSWRGKLARFLEDDNSSTTSSTTEDDSLYEEDTSDWEGSSNEESSSE